jgi:hypothetical protein
MLGHKKTLEGNRMTDDVSKLIKGLENERYAAMIASDMPKLDRLLDDRLRYIHSSGLVDDKASYLSGFGRLWEYRSIDRQDETIVPLGDSALIYAILRIDAVVNGALRHIHSRALTVWARSGGSWRAVAIFSSAIPTEKK